MHDENEVNAGMEDSSLAYEGADKQLTTDLAFFTAVQLKKFHLTNAEGGRSRFPVGYPGLACVHCAGNTNERQLFYTSSDHLQDGFSCITAHIVKCTACPKEIKLRLKRLKSIKSRQNALLLGLVITTYSSIGCGPGCIVTTMYDANACAD